MACGPPARWSLSLYKEAKYLWVSIIKGLKITMNVLCNIAPYSEYGFIIFHLYIYMHILSTVCTYLIGMSRIRLPLDI